MILLFWKRVRIWAMASERTPHLSALVAQALPTISMPRSEVPLKVMATAGSGS